MPYIKQELRAEVAPILRRALANISAIPPLAKIDVVAVAIVELVYRALLPIDGRWRYHLLARGYAVFACARAEFRRRLNPTSDMPEVPPEFPGLDLDELNRAVECMWQKVRALDDIDKDGLLNFLVTELVTRTFLLNEHWTEITCEHVLLRAARKFYLTYVGPYEDGAITKNGDIKAYQK